jgi:hypothetical protein
MLSYTLLSPHYVTSARISGGVLRSCVP